MKRLITGKKSIAEQYNYNEEKYNKIGDDSIRRVLFYFLYKISKKSPRREKNNL